MQGPKLITLLYFNNILNYNNPLTREVSKLKKKKRYYCFSFANHKYSNPGLLLLDLGGDVGAISKYETQDFY